MNEKTRHQVRRDTAKVLKRLARFEEESGEKPIMTAKKILYEIGGRIRGICAGGVGAMHMLARATGLIKELDSRVHLLKFHRPYHESDHVLNIAYNFLVGGSCLEDIELRRNDEVYLDALGATCIPDPTTAGDFCRRFDRSDIEALMKAVNESRLNVWREQPESFFDEAIIEADGTFVETSGECKEGMDIGHDGRWGYHPLLVSLANTGEPLFIENRSGNRPSHEGAAARFDQAIALVRRAGFRKVLLRGDTDFSQTQYLDGWHEDGVHFIFGYDAAPNLVELANGLPEAAWSHFQRESKYQVKTVPRRRPENVKEKVVRRRKFENIHLLSEDVAQFEYSPSRCKKTYRMVVVRKNLTVEKGQKVLYPDTRYFFYITNVPRKEAVAHAIVLSANDRCDQEKLIGQLKSVRALCAPVDSLLSNWAFMVMASVAWSLKAWFALLLPVSPRWREQHETEKSRVLRMNFKTFLQSFVLIPVQIIRSGRRLVYRFLSHSADLLTFFRGITVLQAKLRC